VAVSAPCRPGDPRHRGEERSPALAAGALVLAAAAVSARMGDPAPVLVTAVALAAGRATRRLVPVRRPARLRSTDASDEDGSRPPVVPAAGSAPLGPGTASAPDGPDGAPSSPPRAVARWGLAAGLALTAVLAARDALNPAFPGRPWLPLVALAVLGLGADLGPGVRATQAGLDVPATHAGLGPRTARRIIGLSALTLAAALATGAGGVVTALALAWFATVVMLLWSLRHDGDRAVTASSGDPAGGPRAPADLGRAGGIALALALAGTVGLTALGPARWPAAPRGGVSSGLTGAGTTLGRLAEGYDVLTGTASGPAGGAPASGSAAIPGVVGGSPPGGGADSPGTGAGLGSAPSGTSVGGAAPPAGLRPDPTDHPTSGITASGPDMTGRSPVSPGSPSADLTNQSPGPRGAGAPALTGQSLVPGGAAAPDLTGQSPVTSGAAAPDLTGQSAGGGPAEAPTDPASTDRTSPAVPAGGGADRPGGLPVLLGVLLFAAVAVTVTVLLWPGAGPTPPAGPAWALALVARLEAAGTRRGRPRRADETVMAYADELAAGVLPDDRVTDLAAALSAALFRPEPGASGPNTEPRLRGPNAEPGLRGPNAEPGLRGPNAEPGLRGPNAEPGSAGHWSAVLDDIEAGLSL
jgi:hypothetical protein